jgi:N-acyl-D-amino-acid deacylase
MPFKYDLVIRNGHVFDGSGNEGADADVAVHKGKIVAVGVITERGEEEFDARSALVTPGFVDIHTHYDGQVTWESRLTPSSGHGVSTVVMGNCGVGFAPCRRQDRDMLIKVMEGVEDIPEVVMTEGLPWSWETFPEYLEILSHRQTDIDFATQLPHSALRVYAMGKRGADREPPNETDLKVMRNLTAEAIRAGAIGVSTSRSLAHRTRAGELAPSVTTEEQELHALAGGLNDAGRGVFQLLPDSDGDPSEEFELMKRLVKTSGRPLSFSLLDSPKNPGAWSTTLNLLGFASAEGLPMKAQVFPRPLGILFGLNLSFHPFSCHPSFKKIGDLSLEDKVRAMSQPEMRRRLLKEQPEHSNPTTLMIVSRVEELYVLGNPPCYEPNPEQSVAARARQSGVSTYELLYDELLKQEGRAILYFPALNYSAKNSLAMRTLMQHPDTVFALGDGGAHYGMICDASYPTYVLSRWVRDGKGEDRISLARAIQSLTSVPASTVGFTDRGLLKPGYKADINIIDLPHLTLHAPVAVNNLPSGGMRLSQKAEGYRAAFVSGVMTYREGQATGALPGRLVRGA